MRLRIAIFLLGACALLNVYATQPVLVTMASAFHVDPARAAWTVSATTLGVAAAAVLAGSVSGRYGRKAVMLAALAAMVVVTLGCAAAGNFALLLVLRFGQGLLMPFVFAVAVAYIAEERLADSPATTNAIFVSGTAFGGFLGRFLAAAVASVAGWRACFVALAVVSVVVLAVVAAWLPTERNFQRSASLWASLGGIGGQLRDRRLLGTCLVGGTLLFLQVGSFTFAGLHLQGPPFRLNTVQVGAVFAVLLVAVVVTPRSGRLVDRFGRRPTYLMAGTLALAGLAMTLVPTTAAIVVGLAASSVGVFSGQTCATGQAADSRGERSAAVGLYLTCYYLGGSVGGVVLAPVYSTGGWPACVALLAVMVALGMLVAWLGWPRGAGRTALAGPRERDGQVTDRFGHQIHNAIEFPVGPPMPVSRRNPL